MAYWDVMDESNHRIQGIESWDGETIRLRVDGAMGVQEMEVSFQAALGLAAVINRLLLSPPA